AFFLGTVSDAAEPKQPWQQEWEKTLQAAKKEGRLNFYVGRYGTETFLNEFRKEYPEVKVVTVNGTGNDLATRILTEVRAGKVLADLFSGGAKHKLQSPLQRQGPRFHQGCAHSAGGRG